MHENLKILSSMTVYTIIDMLILNVQKYFKTYHKIKF